MYSPAFTAPTVVVRSGLAAVSGAPVATRRPLHHVAVRRLGARHEASRKTDQKTVMVAEGGEAAAKGGFLARLKESMPTRSERKKLVPLGLMFFVILFNYTILRDTKDVLVVTAAGAEIIPFLKTYCNLPGAILFTVGYAKLSNVITKENLFYACLIPFLIFFAAFGFGMYPNLATLHPSAETMAKLTKNLPASFVAPLAIIQNWTFALFYTLYVWEAPIVLDLLTCCFLFFLFC